MTEKQERVYRIGGWTFYPARNELQNGATRERLEDRSARLLEFLCERRGQVVSREEMTQRVWNGRTISEQSVPVVISELRKALGDDAKAPLFIETVSKRGYRLVDALPMDASQAPAYEAAHEAAESGALHGATGESAFPSRRMVAIFGAAAAIGVIAALSRFLPGPPPRSRIIFTVNNIANATGDPELTPLIASINELSAAYLAGAGDFIFIRDRWDFSAEDPTRGLFEDFTGPVQIYHLSGRMVLAGDAVRLALFINDPETDRILWAKTVEIDRADPMQNLRPVLDDAVALANQRRNAR
ncbi:MAG: hypothetical protein Tsb0010_07670 [Parvularculaceae bacterium]